MPLASELAAPERERVIRETGVGAIIDATGSIRELPVAPDPGFDEEKLAALNPAFIRFSSGTTGTSKGVVISHETLLARVTAANRGLRIGPADRIVWILPMAHHFAVSIMLYLLHGATTVIVNSHLGEDVLSAGDSARRDRALRRAVPPRAARRRAVGPRRGRRCGWRYPSRRPSPCRPRRRSTPATACRFRRVSASSRSACRCSTSSPPAKNPVRWAVRCRISRPRCARATSCTCAGRGSSTPTCARGDGARTCWKTAGSAPATSPRIDADGDIFLLGRSHSVINVGGLKCFPEEIEAVLNELPGVAAARVTGREHPRFGAVPVAEIEPRDPAQPPTARRMATHCRRALASYKVPVSFQIVERIPRTASGKIQR